MGGRTCSRHCGQKGLSFGTRPHVPGEKLPSPEPALLWAQSCGAFLVTALGSSPSLGFCLKRKLVPESRRIKTGFKSYVVQLLGL